VQVVLTRHDAAEAARRVAEFRDLYAEAYDEPPYHYGPKDVEEFGARFERQLARPGFVLIAGEIVGELAGLAYGFVMGPGVWWRNAKTDPPDEIKDQPKFAVIELLVRRAHRGHGYARQLLDTLLEGRSEPSATLLAKPGALAHEMYQRWGWDPVGVVQSYGDWDADDVFVLRTAASDDQQADGKPTGTHERRSQ
jgi:GNAT superfamily N-acetyltransferase